MKIAFITTRPISLDSGSDNRNYHLSKILSQKYEVKIYTPSFTDNVPKNKGKIINGFKKLSLLLQGKVPYIESLKQTKLNDNALVQLKKVDAIQIQEMLSYHVVEKYLKELECKLILDTHNIDYERFLSETNNKGLINKYLGKVISKKVKEIEINAVKKMDHILVCSEKEKEYFSSYIDKRKVSVIPNGVDCKKFIKSNSEAESNIILFMGLLSYAPNSQGIKFYIRKIHPKVIKKNPNAQLMILGKGAPKWLVDVAKKDKSINLVGFVDDVREYISQAQVCICPVYSGSGTRLKILEYMAMGKIVVSTSKGAEGLCIRSDFNILIGDTVEMFSDKINDVLSDDKKYLKIGRNAQKFVNKNYDWSNSGNLLISLYNNL